MPVLYCLDTSVLINSWWEYYRPSFARPFWDWMENAIKQKLFISSDMVLHELEFQKDDLYNWVKQFPFLFLISDALIQNEHKRIIEQYPRLINLKKRRSMCDPWVIALAKLKNCTVVSQEKDAKPGNPPKIPDVCKNEGLKCISVFDLIEEMGWKF